MRKTLIVSALALFAATGAQAYDYHKGYGVLDFHGQLSRADVQAQTLEAARSGALKVSGDEPFSSVRKGVPLVSQRDRASVRAEAVAAAHDPRQNLEAGAFTNSIVPSVYGTAPVAAGAPALAQAHDGVVRQ